MPTLLAQDNPYTAILSTFVPAAGHPSPGYQARLIVLGTVIASLPALATILLGLHVVALRRKGERMWIYRRVKRERGSYIVGARIPLLVIMAYVVSAVFGAALFYGWRFTLSRNGGSEHFQACLFAFWALYYPTTYIFSCANLQAWLVLTSALSARVANAVFGAGLLLGTGGLLSVAVYAIVIVFQFVNEVNPFIGLLYEAAARYEAGQVLSTESQQLLNAQVASLLNVQSSYYSKLSDLLFTVAMAPAPILLVNLAGLALVMAVRHQLKEHDTGALSLGEGEKNKKALRAAEHSLIVDSIFLAAWAAGLMGISLFSAIYLRDITNISWSGAEGSLFGTMWVGSVPFALALLAQVIIAARNLPPRRNDPIGDSTSSSPQVIDVGSRTFPSSTNSKERRIPDYRRGSVVTSGIMIEKRTEVAIEIGEDDS